MSNTLLVLSLAFVAVSGALHRHKHLHHDGRDTSSTFTNEWLVRLDGDQDSAELLALKQGYRNKGEVPGFPGYFLMEKLDHPLENRMSSDVHTRSLREEFRVLWAQQIFHKERVKRISGLELTAKETEFHRKKRQIEDEEEAAIYQQIISFMKRSRPTADIEQRSSSEEERGIPEEILKFWDKEDPVYDETDRPWRKDERNRFNDLLWDHQWYMQDTRTSIDLPNLNLDVLPVFDMGYSGRGVRVCVLDDGIEPWHDDLKKNYDASISWNYNTEDIKGEPDPSPNYGGPNGNPNSHGTRCAGEIAMEANNKHCGVGIAPNASIGGIKLLGGPISDTIEGLSLRHSINLVDIFTASWGPTDDGRTLEGPGRLADQAIKDGIYHGRGGFGIIYIWAAGNGGQHYDNCNCDGYTSSRFTISIGSASESGEFPWFGERCSSTIAAALSSGAYEDQKIATTDLNNTCTVGHTGTSAAAPLAAGIVALALEANPKLTWRDVQHLLVYTSSPAAVSKNAGWQWNAANLQFNSRFGFGIINGTRLVTEAKNWASVPNNVTQELDFDTGSEENPVLFSSGDVLNMTAEVRGAKPDDVNYLEHVELKVSLEYPERGSLEIVLVSPAGTISQLLTARPLDNSTAGFQGWTFMSVHFWGEQPQGHWTALFIDRMSDKLHTGKVTALSLILHGTSSPTEMWLRRQRTWAKRSAVMSSVQQEMKDLLDNDLIEGQEMY